jgi:hypothetical protein
MSESGPCLKGKGGKHNGTILWMFDDARSAGRCLITKGAAPYFQLVSSALRIADFVVCNL